MSCIEKLAFYFQYFNIGFLFVNSNNTYVSNYIISLQFNNMSIRDDTWANICYKFLGEYADELMSWNACCHC
jgi:hypothetical protein